VQTRLYRSPTDRVIGGVAGGLAAWMHIDPSIVRIAWVLLGVFSGGIFVLVYFVMLLVVPLPPAGWTPAPAGWTPPGSGWAPPGTGSAPSSPGEGPVPGWDAGTGGWGVTSEAGPAQPTGWQAAGTPPDVSPRPGGPSPFTTGNAGLVLGGVLVLLGAWFLIDQYIDIDWSLLWPVVVMVLGVALIAGATRRGRAGR
jgi:phage shock protein C